MAQLSDLEDAILFAFRQAYLGHRYDVAEHLLQALEALADGAEDGRLSEAYRLLYPKDHRSE